MPVATIKVKKAFLKTGKKPPRMSPDEKRLAREMHVDQKMERSEIAKIFGRDLSSICRLIAQTEIPNPIGRPQELTEKEVDRIVEVLEKMVDEAEASHEVTMDMLMKHSRAKVCSRVVADAIHKRGYWFRDLRHCCLHALLLGGGVYSRSHVL